MIIGNMTLSSKPNYEDFSDGICESCLSACSEKAIDNSFSDSFGLVTDWDVGSDCCGAPVLQGAIWLDKTSVHTARKEHRNGKIKPGDKYRLRIIKGYYIDDNGKHHGIYEIYKYIMKQEVE